MMRSEQGPAWPDPRALLANMVEGVTKGYPKALEIQGVGYKAELKGKTSCLGWLCQSGHAGDSRNRTVALEGPTRFM